MCLLTVIAMFTPNWSNLQLIGSAITFIQVSIYYIEYGGSRLFFFGWPGVLEVIQVVFEPGDLEEWEEFLASWGMFGMA